MRTLGYDLTINFLVSSIIKIPRANPNGIPQNLEGIGAVEKIACIRPCSYKFVTPMRAVANIATGIAKLRRGPHRGLELRMETRLLRTEKATVLHEDHRNITVDNTAFSTVICIDKDLLDRLDALSSIDEVCELIDCESPKPVPPLIIH